MSTHAIGIDLGGTNLRGAVVNGNLEIVARRQTLTRAEEGPDAIVGRIAEIVTGLRQETGLTAGSIQAIGIGAPGPLDSRAGVVLTTPNMPGWENYPLAAKVEQRTGIAALLENDANCAGWGEYRAGAGAGCRDMVLMTLGTGVGGAVILDGKLRRGPDYAAGEIGHMIVVAGGRQCGCGSRGCLEAYASATATVARFREAMKEGWQSSLAEKSSAAITCEDIFNAANAGDNLAQHVVKETGRYLGLAAAVLANLLNPERCLFSGGMIRGGEILFAAIRAECLRHAFAAPGERLEILPAALAGDAGLVGAASLVLELAGGPELPVEKA